MRLTQRNYESANNLSKTEKIAVERDLERGYSIYRGGATDFFLTKQVDGRITEVIFKEVKSPNDNLSKAQRDFRKIILAIRDGCKVRYVLYRPHRKMKIRQNPPMSKMIKVSDDAYEWLTRNKKGSYDQVLRSLVRVYTGKCIPRRR